VITDFNEHENLSPEAVEKKKRSVVISFRLFLSSVTDTVAVVISDHSSPPVSNECKQTKQRNV